MMPSQLQQSHLMEGWSGQMEKHIYCKFQFILLLIKLLSEKSNISNPSIYLPSRPYIYYWLHRSIIGRFAMKRCTQRLDLQTAMRSIRLPL